MIIPFKVVGRAETLEHDGKTNWKIEAIVTGDCGVTGYMSLAMPDGYVFELGRVYDVQITESDKPAASGTLSMEAA